MRRRASSSRTRAATDRLCSSESCFRKLLSRLAGIVSPSSYPSAQSLTYPHHAAAARRSPADPLPNNLEHDARDPRAKWANRHAGQSRPEGSDRHAHTRSVHRSSIPDGRFTGRAAPTDRGAIGDGRNPHSFPRQSRCNCGISRHRGARRSRGRGHDRPGLRQARRHALRRAAAQSENDRYRRGPAGRPPTSISWSPARPRAPASRQIFHNPTDGWVEAVYVYPLPEGGAVDTLKMVIGERIIVGDIKERKQAREVYEQAKSAGQKASLIEQERPNIFTNSVANIGPARDRGRADRVPGAGAAVGRRVLAARAAGGGAALHPGADRADRRSRRPAGRAGAASCDPVPDRDRISPPVLDPRQNPPVNPVADHRAPAGRLPARRGEEPSPRGQDRNRRRTTPASIKLAEGPVPADRDFELTWKPAGERGAVGRPVPRARRRRRLPARLRDAAGARSRLRSGARARSSSSSTIPAPWAAPRCVQAKASLIYALGRLRAGRPLQRRSASTTPWTCCSPTRCRPTPSMSRGPRRSSAALEARGGTEMVPPMRAALTDRRGSESDFVRQVIFLTDGAIGNEQQLFETIGAMRGRSRAVHGRHRLGAQQLPDDARRRARTRHLHPYRLGRAGRGAHARRCSTSSRARP